MCCSSFYTGTLLYVEMTSNISKPIEFDKMRCVCASVPKVLSSLQIFSLSLSLFFPWMNMNDDEHDDDDGDGGGGSVCIVREDEYHM